jgi:mono/diheme cytochrome c family protein
MPRAVDPKDAGAELEERVRSYLHTNCANCHVEAGGGNAQIDLAFKTPLQKMRLVDVKPLHDSFGISDARLVAPGDPERSVLLRRIATRGTGQMPPLATSRVDEQATQLLTSWIKGLGHEQK